MSCHGRVLDRSPIHGRFPGQGRCLRRTRFLTHVPVRSLRLRAASW
jgi:hypothetical protein